MMDMSISFSQMVVTEVVFVIVPIVLVKISKDLISKDMTVADLIDLLQDLPKDAEVGKIVTRSIGMRDEYEDVFKPFKKMDYKVEFKGDNSVKNVILE